MNTTENVTIGTIGAALSGAPALLENLQAWQSIVAIVCSILVALVTVGLQIYSAVKNRDVGGSDALDKWAREHGYSPDQIAAVIERWQARDREQASESEGEGGDDDESDVH